MKRMFRITEGANRLKSIINTLLIIGILLIFVGVSYAGITGIKYIGLNENKINNCKIDVSFKEGKGISLTNTYPTDYVDAKNYSPYTFYIKNNSSSCDNLKYKITMENTCTGDVIDDKFISYELVNVDTGEVIRGDGINTLNDTFKIRSGSTNSYEMRIWINEKAKSADLYVNGDPNTSKKYCGKLSAEIIATNNLDKTGANEPVLSSNMIPVYYDETNDTWKKADVNNENKNYKWYDYNEGMWANAVTVTETNRETYQKAVLGTPINMDDITTMLVWIPKFEYDVENIKARYDNNGRLNALSKQGPVPLNFILKSQTTPSQQSYKIHSAFTFGNQNLSGIWVSKFAVGLDNSVTTSPTCTTTNCSSADGLRVLPNVKFMTANVSRDFFNVKSMQRAGNPHGFTDEVDVHMIKDIDWGAIAMLSYSKYTNNKCTDTICSNIFINHSNVYTGKSAGGWSTDIKNNKDQFPGETDSTRQNFTYGYYTYNDYKMNYDGTISDVKETGKGFGASTTNSVYGIYDMVGGTITKVMSIFLIENNTFSSGGSRFIDNVLNEFNKINEYNKYIDIYNTESILTACNGFCTDGFFESSGGSNKKIWPWGERGGNDGSMSYTILSSPYYGYGFADNSTFLVVTTN